MCFLSVFMRVETASSSILMKRPADQGPKAAAWGVRGRIAQARTLVPLLHQRLADAAQRDLQPLWLCRC